MNSIRHGATPLQNTLAALAIFALIAMPIGQAFAEEATDPVADTEVQEAPVDAVVATEPATDPVVPETLVDTPEQKVVDDVIEPVDPASAELMIWNPCLTDFDNDCPPQGSITIEKEVVGDVADWSFSFTGSQGAFTLTDEAPSKVFSDLNAGGYTFDEVDTEGWDLIDVKCTDDAEPSATLQAVVAPSDLVVTLESGENVTCTFTNTQEKEPAQNSCLVPEGALETFVVSASPESEFTLQTILGDTADVEDNQYNYQVWDLASDDTDTVTFEVKLFAKHAGNAQEFGYYKAGDTSSFVSLFSVPPKVAGHTISVTVPASFADSLGFAIRTQDGDVSNMWYSEKALNTGNEDHVATYNPDDNTYVLAFEDRAFNVGDEDYNDLVVQIKVLRCSEVETPICQTDANLLKNGSFETPVADANAHGLGFWEIFSGISDWTATAGIELWNNMYGGASEGEQNAELDGNAPTMITQTVATIPGATYELRFDFSARPDADSAADNSVDALVDNVLLMNATADGSDITTNTWSTHTKIFVAGDASTDIALKDIGTANSYGSLVDNVCLLKISDPKPMCELVIVSDATTMVDQEGDDTLAKLVALPIHENWDAVISDASWIWSESPLTDAVNDTYATFLKDFNWYGGVQSATLEIAADNSYEYDLNAASGADATENNFAVADSYNVLGAIVQGENNLAIDVKNWAQPNGTPESNPAGLMYKLTIMGSDPSCSNEPEVPVCASFVSNDYDVVPGQDFDLSWVFGDDVDFVEIDGIEGSFGPLSATEISISEDTTFMLTAYAEGEGDEELFTCSLDVDTHSSGGGHGGSSKKKGSVLGDSEDRPEGGVAGASTAMPAGAPNTGAGGTSPVVVSLPSLLAVLNTRASVRKSK